MSLTLPSQQSNGIPVETKLRTLKQILYEFEHNQQKARNSISPNSKGAKRVLGINKHQNPIKNVKTDKPSTLWHKCTSYYKTLLKERDNKPEKSKKVIKMQQDLLIQQYSRLQRKQKKSMADKKIDSEYERLQQQYCPNFSLAAYTLGLNDKTKIFQGNTLTQVEEVDCSPITYKRLKRQKQKQDKQKLRTISKANKNKKSLTTANNREDTQKSEDSEKTLTPEQPIPKAAVVEEKKPATRTSPPTTKSKVYQDLNKYRVVPKTTGFFKFHNKTLPAIDCNIMDKIFYHQPKHYAAATAFRLKNKYESVKREIEEAIKEGKSTDPLKNNMLAAAIENAHQEHISWSAIQNIIENSETSYYRKKLLHLLQIQLRQRVYILCSVSTCNFTQLILTLDKIMQPFKAQFAQVLQHFTHCCIIEAIIPEKYYRLNPQELKQHLTKDAATLNVKAIDVADAVRGKVRVQCLPHSKHNVCRVLELNGYKILNSNYAFRANKEIILDSKTAFEYNKLMNNLRKIPDIETITDNVLY